MSPGGNPGFFLKQFSTVTVVAGNSLIYKGAFAFLLFLALTFISGLLITGFLLSLLLFVWVFGIDIFTHGMNTLLLNSGFYFFSGMKTPVVLITSALSAFLPSRVKKPSRISSS